MLSEISILEFREWILYSELEPFDEFRADVRTASIVQAISNVFGRRKHALSDFLLNFGDTKKLDKSWQEMKMIGQQMADFYNGSDKKKVDGRRKRRNN